MQLQITFRNMKPSAALETRIRELLERRLERFSNQIISCQVVVAAPHHHHHRQGALFDFQVDIAVPGRDIVIGHSHTKNPAHSNPYVALRDAFRAARRQLQDYEKIRRQDLKGHTLSQPSM